jgi:hypothetical protein
MEQIDPQPESLRTQLSIEWNDHFQTRDQSWRALQIEALFLVGLIGADVRFENIWLVTIVGGLVFLGGVMGFSLTMTHWVAQERKISNIHKIETALGLTTVIDGHTSGGVHWSYLLNPKSTLGVVFLARMHLVLVCLSLSYVIATMVLQSSMTTVGDSIS